MKQLSLVILIFIGMSCSSQLKVNNRISDIKTGKEIMYGACNREGLKQIPYAEWYHMEYNNYDPQTAVVAEIEKNIQAALEIKVVMGTWCSDSRREVPHFYKVLDNAGFNEANLKLICVDTSKSAAGFDMAALDIKRVPTFIFYSAGKEIGRIVEIPQTTLEQDMLNLLMAK